MTDKQRFISLLMMAAGNRQGFGDFVEWLEDTDFFEAPASSKYHGSSEGMLCRHSLNVHYRMQSRQAECNARGIRPESCIVAPLLHDICKVNFYVKDGEKYKYNNNLWLPVGHGERSVMLIQQHMTLTEEEMVAIRWHMGAYDDAAKGGSRTLSEVFKKYPLALMLHLSDMEAAYLDEAEEQTCKTEQSSATNAEQK